MSKFLWNEIPKSPTLSVINNFHHKFPHKIWCILICAYTLVPMHCYCLLGTNNMMHLMWSLYVLLLSNYVSNKQKYERESIPLEKTRLGFYPFTNGLDITIHKVTVPWPLYICTYIKLTLTYCEHETHTQNSRSSMM